VKVSLKDGLAVCVSVRVCARMCVHVCRQPHLACQYQLLGHVLHECSIVGSSTFKNPLLQAGV
jgi:hypothetical protein